MKKNILAMLGIVLALSFVACGSADNSKAAQVEADVARPEAEEETVSEIEVSEAEENAEENAEIAETAETVEIEEESSLSAFLASDDMQEQLVVVNESLKESGLQCEFEADGDVFILKYTFIDQIDLGDASAEDVSKMFKEGVAPVLEEQGKSMAEAFSSEGVDVSKLEIIIINADGTELFDDYFDM